MRRIILGLVLASVVGVIALPAQAMCQPGYVGMRNGKPVVELPRCDPFPG